MQMEALNCSCKSRSTTFRDAIVSVSMVEISLHADIVSASRMMKTRRHVRLKRVHVVQALRKLDRRKLNRRREDGVRVPLLPQHPPHLPLEQRLQPLIAQARLREDLHDPFPVPKHIHARLAVLPAHGSVVRERVELGLRAAAHAHALVRREQRRGCLRAGREVEVRRVGGGGRRAEERDVQVNVGLLWDWGKGSGLEVDVRLVEGRGKNHGAVYAGLLERRRVHEPGSGRFRLGDGLDLGGGKQVSIGYASNGKKNVRSC